MKRAICEGKLLSLYDIDTDYNDYFMNDTSFMGYIDEGTGIIYPSTTQTYISKNPGKAGFYKHGPFLKFIEPSDEERDNFTFDKLEHVDWDNTSSISDVVAKSKDAFSLDNRLLSNVTPDNIFAPPIHSDDSPEMVGMKTAIAKKKIDLDLYGYRFGENFNNDKRIFDKPSMTLNKLVTICDKTDIDAYLILKDKDGDIPNPMGEEIVVKLTNGTEEEGNDEQ